MFVECEPMFVECEPVLVECEPMLVECEPVLVECEPVLVVKCTVNKSNTFKFSSRKRSDVKYLF